MDGSSAPFVELIDETGIRELSAPRRYIKVLKPIKVQEGESWGELASPLRFPPRRRDRLPDAADRQAAPLLRNEPRRFPQRDLPGPHLRLHERRRETLESRSRARCQPHQHHRHRREQDHEPRGPALPAGVRAPQDARRRGRPRSRRQAAARCLPLGARAATVSTRWWCRRCSPTRTPGPSPRLRGCARPSRSTWALPSPPASNPAATRRIFMRAALVAALQFLGPLRTAPRDRKAARASPITTIIIA